VFGTQAKTGAIVNENSALTVATFAACVNILASSMSNFPLRLMRETAKGSEPATDHPLYDLVAAAPNAGQTSFRWRSFLQSCLCLGGNGYTEIVRDRYNDVVALVPMLPFKVQPRAIEGGQFDGMVVYRYKGRQLLPHDVLHLRGLSTDGFFGISPIRAMRESLGLSLSMQEFTARGFNNGNRQPGVIKGPPQWNEEKAKEFLKMWQSTQAGAQNAGRTPVLFGGVEWQNAGWSNQDAELLLSRKFEKEEIASWFRIPLVLVGDTEKTSSWGTGIEQLTRGFVMFTLQPWATNWEQELNFSLLTADERRQKLYFKFDFSELLRGSVGDQANYLKTLWGLGAVSANEVRRQFHMPEIPDVPGDLHYVPANFVVAGTTPSTAAKAAADAADKEEKIESDTKGKS
jgi:HK97 family phage portal protein